MTEKQRTLEDFRDHPLVQRRSSPFPGIIPFFHGPFWRTGFTDIISPLHTAQTGTMFCANMEMMMLNCLEQYGYERGKKMCMGYMFDLEECKWNFIENARIDLMREERERQYKAGERKQAYEEAPPRDAY